ncbi:hypothetical protein BDN71DRAFT_1504771 [Pleurotus eryngii]|uniref:RING-type domain-containing protein n=2 Tax=Pleurotus TaxID=5320 RepID=A0A067NCZ3_PLEO1|nr:hypothetical protein BDN71DRAFT_1504771 [Pleurotus eryngii]KDQ25868.1 hypothetical protein PLEOSDRAFT_1106761 [Pleurotus ostreatus PC15]
MPRTNSSSRASTPNSSSRASTPYTRDRTPTVHSRPRAPTPYSRARAPYVLNHETLGSEELAQLTQQLGQARAASDAMLGRLLEQVDVTRAALQAATADANQREVDHQTEINELKDKISCLDGGDVQRFEEMTATIADLQESHTDLQSTYNVLLRMHTSVRVSSQRLTAAHEDLKAKFETVNANHGELQRTCQETNSKAAAFQALVEFVHCAVCDTTMTEPRVLTCGHLLCVNCVERWSATGGNCPFCRVPMEPRVIVGLKDVIEKVVAVQVPGASRNNPIELELEL